MPTIYGDVLALLCGIVCAWLGGEFFVRGLIGLARWARIPTALVGVTVAAFATSGPEMAVAIKAALAGAPMLSVGDVTGSNVVNVALILALAALWAPLRAKLGEVRRDFFVALAVPILLGVLAWDGHFSRLDGAILMAVFVGWLIGVILEALHRRSQTEEHPEPQFVQRIIWQSVLGIAFLVAAGHFIVVGAKGIALAAGLTEFIVGATVVAVATGTPELATTIISRARGHDDLGFGNILGSNIFNGLFIVGLVVLIRPFDVRFSGIALALAAGVVTTLLAAPWRGTIGRAQGLALVGCYAAYVMVLLTRGE